MSEVTLTAETGRPTGSASSRRIRATGKVPGVVYGLDGDPVAVAVDWPDLRRALTTDAGTNALITLDVDGDSQLTLVKDLQRHPVRRDVLHVDFIRIDPNAEIGVEVPLVLVGEAKEVYDNDGMVDQNLFTLAVLSRPDAIPNQIDVDVSGLEIGTSVTVGDLALPSGVRTEIDEEEAVALGTVTRSTIEAIEADEFAEALEELDAAADEGGDAGAASAEDSGDGDGGE